MVKFHGLSGVFRADRVKTTLDTIKANNAAVTPYGAADLATPEGKLAEGVGYGAVTFFIPEIDMLGATYMYEGQHEFGLELVRRCQVALNQKVGLYVGSTQCDSRGLRSKDPRHPLGSEYAAVDCARSGFGTRLGAVLRHWRNDRWHAPCCKQNLV